MYRTGTKITPPTLVLRLVDLRGKSTCHKSFVCTGRAPYGSPCLGRHLRRSHPKTLKALGGGLGVRGRGVHKLLTTLDNIITYLLVRMRFVVSIAPL